MRRLQGRCLRRGAGAVMADQDRGAGRQAWFYLTDRSSQWCFAFEPASASTPSRERFGPPLAPRQHYGQRRARRRRRCGEGVGEKRRFEGTVGGRSGYGYRCERRGGRRGSGVRAYGGGGRVERAEAYEVQKSLGPYFECVVRYAFCPFISSSFETHNMTTIF